MKRLFIVLAFCTVGCASSSGVYSRADGTFGVSTTAITSFGGTGTARASAVRSAEQHCAALGKRMEVVTSEAQTGLSQGSSEITFRCQ